MERRKRIRKTIAVASIKRSLMLRELDEEHVLRLMADIDVRDLIHPIPVLETGPDEYETLGGEHRLEAFIRLGRIVIEADVCTEPLDELDAEFEGYLDNALNKQMTDAERGAFYLRRMTGLNINQSALARSTGDPEWMVSRCLKIYRKASPAVMEMLTAGSLQASAVLLIADFPEEKQLEIAEQVVVDGRPLKLNAIKALIKRIKGEAKPKPGPKPRSTTLSVGCMDAKFNSLEHDEVNDSLVRTSKAVLWLKSEGLELTPTNLARAVKRFEKDGPKAA